MYVCIYVCMYVCMYVCTCCARCCCSGAAHAERRRNFTYQFEYVRVRRGLPGCTYGRAFTHIRPCGSSLRARRGGGAGPVPVRTNEYIMGLSNLNNIDETKVMVGNLTMLVTSVLIRLCVVLNIPCILENPCTSLLWLAPPIAKLLLNKACQSYNVDFCAFKTPWRKRTSRQVLAKSRPALA